MLDGTRVLDLTRLLPGGYCTRLLADLGAGVIKVEQPRGGDPLRTLAGGDAYFAVLHAGKRSVALPLKTPAAREALKRLAGRADVLVEGFRPGVMQRLGLSFDDLEPLNPRLVYCSITGHGSGGPLEQRAGHDLNYLALSGVLSLMPRPVGVPIIPGVQVADLAGAQAAVIAILAAMVERSRTGRGRRVEISMTDVMRDWSAGPLNAQRSGITPLALTGQLPCYHVYQVKDGFLTVAALEARFWLEFCRAIGREQLGVRQFDQAAIAEVASVLKEQTRDDWMRAFGERDVCVQPCLELAELPPGSPRSHAPRLGEHTAEVLSECGLSPQEIAAVHGSREPDSG